MVSVATEVICVFELSFSFISVECYFYNDQQVSHRGLAINDRVFSDHFQSRPR